MLYYTAITRKPGPNFSDGITSAHLGKPDLPLVQRQHKNYVGALKSCGLEVIVLEADPGFPDGCFVEDTAIVTPEIAVITNPGTLSRNGETKSIIPVLQRFRKLFFIESPGTMDGGDVLRAENRFFVGISERTNEQGIRQFDAIVRLLGYTTTAVPLDNLLHLKSGIAYIGRNRIIAVEELAKRKEFQSYDVIKLVPEEDYASNCIRIDTDQLIIPRGYSRIKKTLNDLHYKTIELEMTEFQKMDGGLTCLSLLF